MAQDKPMYGVLVISTEKRDGRLFVSNRKDVMDQFVENLKLHADDYINKLESYDEMLRDVTKYIETFVRYYELITLGQNDFKEILLKYQTDSGYYMNEVDATKMIKAYGADQVNHENNKVIVYHKIIKL